MTKEVAVWTPKPFKGTDLLVTGADAAVPAEVADIPIVGSENIEMSDLILPSIVLLHGTSKPVTDGVEGAQVGKLYNTLTGRIYDPPLRAIVVHHNRSNALFPQADDKRTKGLKTCISRDGVTGTEYGLCEECRRCLDWTPDGGKPLGSRQHVFCLLTTEGPALVRFGRTSYKAGKEFLSAWQLSPQKKNSWAHPVVLSTVKESKTLNDGKSTTYHRLEMRWDTTEAVPAEVQRQCYSVYQSIHDAYEAGRLASEGSHDEELPFA